MSQKTSYEKVIDEFQTARIVLENALPQTLYLACVKRGVEFEDVPKKVIQRWAKAKLVNVKDIARMKISGIVE